MGERCYLFKNLFLEIYFKTCYLRKEKPVSLVFGPGAMGKPRGSRWGGRWEGGSGWGTHVNPWLFHFNVWQNPLQIKIKKKKYCVPLSLQSLPPGDQPLWTQSVNLCSHWTGSVFLHSSVDGTCLPFGWCPACMLTLLFGKTERNRLFRLNLETVCNPDCGFWSVLIYLTTLDGICKASAVGDIAINRLSFRPSQSSLS